MTYMTMFILASAAFAADPAERLQLNCEIAETSKAPEMAETESERTERLFNDFEYALLMFDRCLEVATDSVQSSSSSADGGGGGGEAGGEAADDESALSGSESESEASDKSQSTADTPNSAKGGMTQQDSTPIFTNPAPEGVGDGNDDDVVAKQLREAAMAEQDPIVREKLWDEYRKYKGIKK